ncbi:hypothetical protein VNO77_08159 [Canavalia gladiata]|uniref:Uncharacterized protein n=1 Tax=Canavalia gladiata TaxID=3824 RepID=A0AAN9QW42_CANGL
MLFHFLPLSYPFSLTFKWREGIPIHIGQADIQFSSPGTALARDQSSVLLPIPHHKFQPPLLNLSTMFFQLLPHSEEEMILSNLWVDHPLSPTLDTYVETKAFLRMTMEFGPSGMACGRVKTNGGSAFRSMPPDLYAARVLLCFEVPAYAWNCLQKPQTPRLCW